MANAFQKPPFQNTGFQAVFSVNAFQQCAFQYPGFQTDECPVPEQSARSGVWRLWLYKLQEDLLKKRREETKETIKEQVKEIVKPENDERPSKVRPKNAVVVETVEKSPPTPVKPLYRPTISVYDESLAEEAWSVVSSTLSDVAYLQPYLDAIRRRQEQEEEDIEIMLLAA